MNRQQISHYLFSIPERTIRALSAVVGGAIHEVGEVVLPARVRRSRLYTSLVESTVRFLVEQIGEVDAQYPVDAALPKDFLIRRTAGNVVEIAGLVTFHASPVWVFAALSDLAGAGRELITEISTALQEEGLLEKGQSFESVDQLLDGLDRTSARLAEAANTPPLNIAGLREEWRMLRKDAPDIRPLLPSPARLWNQWNELKEEAVAQGRSVAELSSLMALSAVRGLPENASWLSRAASAGGRRTGRLIARGLLDHYRGTLAEIRSVGYLAYWVSEFRPYFVGAARHFSPGHLSGTERLLARRRSRT
jgi:hypothetical protein